jgi:hypothetical protein
MEMQHGMAQDGTDAVCRSEGGAEENKKRDRAKLSGSLFLCEQGIRRLF